MYSEVVKLVLNVNRFVSSYLKIKTLISFHNGACQLQRLVSYIGESLLEEWFSKESVDFQAFGHLFQKFIRSILESVNYDYTQSNQSFMSLTPKNSNARTRYTQRPASLTLSV